MSNEPKLAAELSCVLATPGRYLPVIDGPRMTRPDKAAEVIRRTNAIARVKPEYVFLAGLPAEAIAAISAKLPQNKVVLIRDSASALKLSGTRMEVLNWGPDPIGLGLLEALRSKRMISFDANQSPLTLSKPRRTHLVICESGEPLSEVIAANYAYALSADLFMIPPASDKGARELLEAYYSLYEFRKTSPADRLADLQQELRLLCGLIPIPSGGSATFISKELPYGAAFPEIPSTHLFTYPDLGIAVINGFAAEQPGTRGVQVAALVDPDATDAQEIEAARKLLPERRIFVRGYQGRDANVQSIAQMVENFPYDLLIFATHCGDVPGHRWTYEFRDSEGIDRTLVVDIALGIGRTDDANMLDVTQLMRFHELDGVDWTDTAAKANHYIGNAVRDFIELKRAPDGLQPVKKARVERVFGSAALKMFDNNYIPLPRSLANERTPIIINNACASWHELAGRFTFGNARAYVGTLYPVTSAEASEVIVRLLDKSFGKPLAHALWVAQRGIYGDNVRRPYVVTGVYTQRLRTTLADVPRSIERELAAGLRGWALNLARVRRAGDEEGARRILRIIKWFERELRDFRKRWPSE